MEITITTSINDADTEDDDTAIHTLSSAVSVSQIPESEAASDPDSNEIEHKYDTVPLEQLQEEKQEHEYKHEHQDIDMIVDDVDPLPSEPTPEELNRIIAALEARGKRAPEEKERLSLIDEEHARGHFGREAIFRALLRRHYWWPRIRRDIQTRIKECIPCLRHVIGKTGFDPATPFSAAFPFDHMQIDIMKLPKSKHGYVAILVIVDVCTGFILLRPIKDITAESIAPELWKLFNDFGFPRVVQSDNGPEFTSRVFKELIRISGVDHRRITPYQPRTDGKVERNIGTVKLVLAKLLHGVHEDWPAFVPWAQSSINNKVSLLTGSTPFSLMFGRKFNPYQDYTSTAPLDTLAETEWARRQDQMIAVIYPSIAERVAAQKVQMKRRLDKRQRAVNFRKGDVVMLRRKERVMNEPLGALENEYTGPYIIESKNRTGAIILIAPNGTPLSRLVRPNQLKFVSHNSKPYKQDVFEIEKIIAHRGEGESREYLIHWKGYPSDEDTWEPVSSLFDAEFSIQEYHNSLHPPQIARRTASQQ